MTRRGEIVYRKYRIEVRGFPAMIVVHTSSAKAKGLIFRGLQEAGYYCGNSFTARRAAQMQFFRDFSCKALGVTTETGPSTREAPREKVDG